MQDISKSEKYVGMEVYGNSMCYLVPFFCDSETALKIVY